MKVTVIGIGRVGLPLALHLDAMGHEVYVYDRNPVAYNAIIERKSTFSEPSINDALAHHRIRIVNNGQLEKTDAYIITVGTPVNQHFLPDTSMVEDALGLIIRSGFMQHSLTILRSTIPPGFCENFTTMLFKTHNMVLDLDYNFAYCPERIAEGAAFEEMNSHPQIIGTDWDSSESALACIKLFRQNLLVFRTYKEAEVMKLATNTYRMMHFAISNYLQMACDKHDVDFGRIADPMSYGYPRLKTMAKPGFVAGTCLRKDFAMLGQPGDLAFQSYMTNERYPQWIADTYLCQGQRVAILGAGFKDGSDDLRDSHVEMLYNKVIAKTGLEPYVVDFELPEWQSYTWSGGTSFVNQDIETVSQYEFDVVIFGTPCTKQAGLIEGSGILDDKIVLDPWVKDGQLQTEY